MPLLMSPIAPAPTVAATTVQTVSEDEETGSLLLHGSDIVTRHNCNSV